MRGRASLLVLLLTTAPALAQGGAPLTLPATPPPSPRVVHDLPYDVIRAVVSERWVLLVTGSIVDAHYRVHDMETGETTTVPHRAAYPYFVVDTEGRHAVMLLAEAGTDFDGDGDTTDSVYFRLDLATGALTNSEVPLVSGAPLALLTPDWAFLGAVESPGRDLNGDGDSSDIVIQAWDLASSEPPVNTGIAMRRGAWAAHESFVLFHSADELFDVHVYDASTGQHLDTDLVALEFMTAGTRSALLVDETQLTGDLNGDGDLFDQVLHVFDTGTGALVNLAHAVGARTLGGAGHGGTVTPPRFQLTETGVAFYVSEERHGNTDLDGDADTEDSVLFLHSFQTGLTTNLGVAGWDYRLGEEVLAVQAVEEWQGEDLDGDGDRLDRVLHVALVAGGAPWNVGVATCGSDNTFPPVLLPGTFLVHGPRVVFAADSACTTSIADATSLSWIDTGASYACNGSGHDLALLSSNVVSFFRTGTGQVVHTGIRATGILPSDFARAHPFLVREINVGRDLNRDGDQLDTLLRVVSRRL